MLGVVARGDPDVTYSLPSSILENLMYRLRFGAGQRKVRP